MVARQYDLGDAELEAMKVLWDHGALTVREVLTHLHEAGRRVAYTTAQTLLNRLEQKGYVKSDKSEFAYVYRARLTRERLTRSRLKTLVQQLYGGAAGPLVLQLIQNEQFTAQEIEELHQLIERLDKEAPEPEKK